MKRWLVSAFGYVLLTTAALAQGLTLPGPGLPHSSGGGGGSTPTHIQGNTTQNGAGSVTTASTTMAAVGSGHAVIITYCGVLSPGFVITFSDNATGSPNTYTNWTGTINNATAGYSCAQGYASNVTGNPTSFSGTSNFPGTFVAVVAEEYSNVLATSPADGSGAAQPQNSPGTGANAVTSGAFTTAANGDLIYGFSVSIGSTGMTNGTGFTAQQFVASTFYTQSLIQAAASASTACTMTDLSASDDTITFCLALKHS